MKKILLVHFFLCSVLALMAQGVVLERSFVHDDSVRTYLLYVPAAFDGSDDWPLVINLHGYTGNAEVQMIYTDMNVVADTGHFLVAYPNGLTMTSNLPYLPHNGQGWNSSPEGDSLYYSADNVDDVGFLLEAINHIDADYGVNRDRVYATGFSSGGTMTYRLACEQSEVFAAIASASGPARSTLACTPKRAVPILHIHGTSDPNFGYDAPGDPFVKSREETIQFWLDQNECGSTQTIKMYPDINQADSSTAELQQWDNCIAEVSHLKVTGGGHHIPGATDLIFPPFFGNLNMDIHGSEEIWKFFDRNIIVADTIDGVDEVNGVADGIDGVKVFPNPANDVLNIEFDGLDVDRVHLYLYNNIGQLILEQKFDDMHTDLISLNVAGVGSGIHFLQVVINDEGMTSQSLIIAK